MKPKIIQVIPSFRTGGAEALVKNYLVQFDRARYDVEAFVTGKRWDSSLERELEACGIPVTYLSELYSRSRLPGKPGHILTALRWRRAVRTYFRQAGADVIHCHLNVAQMLTCADREIGNAKMFYTVHSDPDRYWGNHQNEREVEAVKKLMNGRSFRFFALHPDAIPKIQVYFGKECRVQVLNNGVDTARYRRSEAKGLACRRLAGISEQAFVMGHVGRFSEPKNHAYLLEVFREVRKKRADARLLLLGDGELRASIEATTQAWGMSDAVSFMGNQSNVGDWLSAFDVFVFPSLWEGLPLTLIEAQAAELPCFVSDSVTREIDCSNLMTYLPLEIGAEKWAEHILSYEKKAVAYSGLAEYDIHTVMDNLEKAYGVAADNS